MLTQCPGSYLGDKFGHHTIIVVSVAWAGLATSATGLMSAVLGFVALRIITGLGEDTFYSNDGSTIIQYTSFEKRSFGMGVAITGLPIGITIAFATTPFLIDLGNSVLGSDNGWRIPFFVLGVVAVFVWF